MSFRLKLGVLVGGIISLLLVSASVAVLQAARYLLVENLKRESLHVASAFSVFVLDTLIHGHEDLLDQEEILDNYILDFLGSEPTIYRISVYGPRGRRLAGSDFSAPSPVAMRSPAGEAAAIRRDEELGWVVEAVLPLTTGERRWGTLEMVSDAGRIRRELAFLFWALTSVTVMVIAVFLVGTHVLVSRLTDSLRRLAGTIEHYDAASGEVLDLPASADEVGVLTASFNDLTHRLAASRDQVIEAQEHVHRAEKLASVGRLASGVAHEINNPLNGIQNCLLAIRREPDNRRQTEEYLELAGEGLDQIEMVVRKLLGFARPQPRVFRHVDVNEVLRKVLGLLEYKLRSLRLELALAQDLPGVHGDPLQLQEVFLNLVLNSVDAIEARRERTSMGSIAVTTRTEDSETLRVVVADDGIGIEPETLKRIFEPFHTTKEPGVGTGLGLAVSLSIVEAHGGSIGVSSRPGEGTEIEVTLPLRPA